MAPSRTHTPLGGGLFPPAEPSLLSTTRHSSRRQQRSRAQGAPEPPHAPPWAASTCAIFTSGCHRGHRPHADYEAV